ncbi:COG4705 family protein [Solirubrobacter soli]|uniref:COG4705 family protein n=1 Tax=Solirubrobacter soli TaxID=363832 RepID=UPI0003FF8820|nr:hypothetical protein [Solirubrobacter soli]
MKRSSAERLEPLAAKVPEITLLFWAIKVLTTGMGESMSDFLGQKSIPIGGAIGVLGFAFAMRLQLRQRTYRASVYWFAVAMVAIFGTMVADVLKDGTGVSYAVTTPVFAAITALVFYRWHRSEGTLSIHSITTRRRERYYWSAVLATFALGTAAGDLTAITLHLGFFASIVLFAAVISIPALLWWRGLLNPIVAFWSAYVVTRPLGASIVDWLGKARVDTGVGLGDGTVSALALIVFAALVAYAAVSRTDVQRVRPRAIPQPAEG